MNPYVDHTDEDLMTLLRVGNTKAFETIYRRYASTLYRYARKNISIPEDCEEMVQDIFASLWARRETLKVASLQSYLLKSMRYMVIRHFRHKGVEKRYVEHFKIFAALSGPGDPDPQNEESLRSMILKCLEGLPERCKMAIKLRLTYNLSNQEIAQRMNISKRTVELYVTRALSHLRTSLPSLSRAR